jgi:hypothetical protein
MLAEVQSLAEADYLIDMARFGSSKCSSFGLK